MRCPACGSSVDLAARFCAQCGGRLHRPVEDAGVIAGDRRIVTALFADLVDYVRLVAEHDAEDVQREVDAAFGAMAAAIRRFDGTVEKFIGDAIFAVFGAPNAHDDDALRAVRCAIAIRDALAGLGRASASEPLEVRITLATGEVVAAHRVAGGVAAASLTGPAVVTAARLQEVARPGEILADAATIHAVRRPLVTDDRGRVELRGHPEPVHVMAVEGDVGSSGARSAAGGVLVGRATEVSLVLARVNEIVHTGRGRMVVLTGPAGVGKTRLASEIEGAALDRGLRSSWADNVSYGTAEPYRFIRVLAQRLADEVGTDSGTLVRRWLFTPETDAETMRRIGGAIAAVARDAEFSGWEAEAAYAPTDPARVRAGIAEAAALYTARMGDELGPRVIVIDDAHWLDPASAEVMGELVRAWLAGPFLVVVTTRAEDLPAWLLEADPVRIDLAGLPIDETQALVESVAGRRLADRDLVRLHERTAGNPLFVVELVRAGLERGSFEESGGSLGQLSPDGPGPIPLTLRSLIGARVDTLDAAGRELIEVAAVVGMTFDLRVVEAVLGGSIDPAVIDGLEEAGMIVPATQPDLVSFAHPLIHDVVYLGVLASRRRVLHGRLAALLAEREPRVGLGVVALQWAAAGNSERAVPLLIEAAEEAASLGAPAEAAGFWRMAARLLGDDPQAEDLRRRAEAVPSPG